MATRYDCSGSAPSTLPPPRPKSPPEYPDLYGKRREMAKVQVLEREIGFLEVELKSVDGLQPASRCCKELVDFVAANSDPLIPTYKKNHGRCHRFWKWLCGLPCFNPSWIYCCCCCSIEMPQCCFPCDCCCYSIELPRCHCPHDCCVCCCNINCACCPSCRPSCPSNCPSCPSCRPSCPSNCLSCPSCRPSCPSNCLSCALPSCLQWRPNWHCGCSKNMSFPRLCPCCSLPAMPKCSFPKCKCKCECECKWPKCPSIHPSSCLPCCCRKKCFSCSCCCNPCYLCY